MCFLFFAPQISCMLKCNAILVVRRETLDPLYHSLFGYICTLLD
jgi:hypothetical protein